MFGREYLKVCDKNEEEWCYSFIIAVIGLIIYS